jgi:hypothetical protein
MSKEIGERKNDGKLKWSLVSMVALEPMVKVLMFGAEKYTKFNIKLVEKYLSKWNVKHVASKEKLKHKECVGVVMNNNCLITIQNISKEGVNINENTDKNILKDLKNLTNKETLLGQLMLNIKEVREISTILTDMEFHLKNLTPEEKKVVNYVENNLPLCTQTITMKLESFEVSFAVSAIMDSDSLMMTLICLEELLNISLVNEKIVTSGKNNWKKGLKYSEICESLQRHLNAFVQGENNDPESKLAHIGHILCNAMFLSYMTLFRTDLDDRYVDEPYKKELPF